MDIMTPDLLDQVRARQGNGSMVVLVTSKGEATYPWNDTDADWEQILKQIGASLNGSVVTYCGVVTEGVTVNPVTYEMDEHSDMVVVHRAGHQCYRVHFDEEVVIDNGECSPNDMDFDLAALRSVLWP